MQQATGFAVQCDWVVVIVLVVVVGVGVVVGVVVVGVGVVIVLVVVIGWLHVLCCHFVATAGIAHS